MPNTTFWSEVSIVSIHNHAAPDQYLAMSGSFGLFPLVACWLHQRSKMQPDCTWLCISDDCIQCLQTAEMPGLYQPGEYDVAGFAVGSVKQDRVIDGKQIQEGDVLVGLPSSGLHSNGYSLVRKVVEVSTLDALMQGAARCCKALA